MTTPKAPLVHLVRIAFTLAVILGPGGALAFDLSPDATRVVSDPAYLPAQGRFFGSTLYTYGKTTSDLDNYLGLPQSSNQTTVRTATQLFEYGASDDLTFRLSGFYQSIGSTGNYASGATTFTRSGGMSDPTLGLTWRFLDQARHAVSVDFVGSYTPDLIYARSATSSSEGTVARGGATGVLGAAVSRKTKSFTVYGEATATSLGTRAIQNPSNNVVTNYDTSWQYTLFLTTQSRLTGRWSLNLGLAETVNDRIAASFVNTVGKLVEFTNTPGRDTRLNAALNFQVVPNRLVASVTYTHDTYCQGSNNFPVQFKSDTTTPDKKSSSIGVDLRYVL